MISSQGYADAVRPVRDPVLHGDAPRDVLAELADVVLDNGAPYGDALLSLDGGGVVCAISPVTTALLAQLLTAAVVRRFHQAGEVPPVYLSADVPGGDEHNLALESRYPGRLRRTA